MASPRLTPIAQRAQNAERRLAEVQKERDALREFIKDLAENGTRFDLTPTLAMGANGMSGNASYDYIKRMDESIRKSAKKVLRDTFDM